MLKVSTKMNLASVSVQGMTVRFRFCSLEPLGSVRAESDYCDEWHPKLTMSDVYSDAMFLASRRLFRRSELTRVCRPFECGEGFIENFIPG